MFNISNIALVLAINVLLVSATSSVDDDEEGSSLLEDRSPIVIAWLQGRNKETGEPVKILFSNESDSEIVMRELKDVSVHCEAEYPVQLDFKSHGGFKLLATGSGSSSKSFYNGTHQLTVQKHTTYVHLVSLKEAYTGLYTCRGRSSQTRNYTNSASIYVPTDKLFVSKRTADIGSSGQKPIVIPCAISDPNATVTLVKLYGEDTIKPVLSTTYNSKVGFFLESDNDTASSTNLEGTYYCIAKTKKVHRAIEYNVIEGPATCTQRCGENSKCQLVNDQQVCECKPRYTETLVSEKCLLECRTDSDCPKNMACMPQESGSFLLDILTTAEGRTSSMMDDFLDPDDERHIERIGECKNPCIFRTTTCSLGEVRNDHEECRVKEHKAICHVYDHAN